MIIKIISDELIYTEIHDRLKQSSACITTIRLTTHHTFPRDFIIDGISNISVVLYPPSSLRAFLFLKLKSYLQWQNVFTMEVIHSLETSSTTSVRTSFSAPHFPPKKKKDFSVCKINSYMSVAYYSKTTVATLTQHNKNIVLKRIWYRQCQDRSLAFFFLALNSYVILYMVWIRKSLFAFPWRSWHFL